MIQRTLILFHNVICLISRNDVVRESFFFLVSGDNVIEFQVKKSMTCVKVFSNS